MNPGNAFRRGLMAAILLSGCVIFPLQASPFIDELNTLDNIGNDSGSCAFNLIDGRLEATWKSGYFGVALLGWNIGGPDAFNSNLSLDPADHQTIFVIKGINPITPAGIDNAELSVIIYTSSTGLPGDGRPAVLLEVDPAATDFIFDVASLSQMGFWSAQVSINADSKTKTGYSFESFSAIPEPATLSLLALGSLAALKRKRA